MDEPGLGSGRSRKMRKKSRVAPHFHKQFDCAIGRLASNPLAFNRLNIREHTVLFLQT